MRFSFLSLTVFAALVSAALSCSCIPRRFRKDYCDAKTSVRVKVLARTDNCKGTCDPINDQDRGRFIYILKVTRKFKGVAIEDNVMFASTPVNDGLCGVILGVGKVYLLNIGGPVTGSKCPKTTYSVILCDFPVLWKRVTKGQRRFLNTNSKTGDSLCP